MRDLKEMTPDEAVKRLLELADGFACAARISNVIVSSFQVERQAYLDYKIGDATLHDVRLIRAVIDEESNARRLLTDEAAIRLLLGCVEAGFKP